MKHTTTTGRYRMATLPILVTLVAACAAPVPANNRALDDARSIYQQASGDELVARSAPGELRRAQIALQQAESALKAGQSAAAVEHFAYLAHQRSELALQAGLIAKAEQAVVDARRERERILMDARMREADQSRAMAEASRKQAETQAQRAQRAKMEADAARAKNAQLREQLSELQAKETSRGMVLTLGDVLFDSGHAELKSGAMRTLDQLTTFLRENPERTLTIEGYTDSVGSNAFNLDLSQRRAEAVVSALTQRGIDGGRLKARGFGEASPVASNTTAAGRQRNRRVEVVISSTP
jgi:outer membrane protein OmpA-like peptidoglycan-associated protein